LHRVDELTRLAMAAADGDRGALHEFVRASQADVWRLCAHLGDRDRADDLTQETYLRALRALPSFRADASARTWLLAIARRTVADALRTSGRRRRLEARLGPARHETAPGPGPAERVALRDAVAHLEADRRAAFVLTQMLGLAYAEAAQVCGCPVGTIRSRLARARADLVAALADDASSAL
jgi:RNA polymerase sigma-70 factor, ECF subfamily